MTFDEILIVCKFLLSHPIFYVGILGYFIIYQLCKFIFNKVQNGFNLKDLWLVKKYRFICIGSLLSTLVVLVGLVLSGIATFADIYEISSIIGMTFFFSILMIATDKSSKELINTMDGWVKESEAKSKEDEKQKKSVKK